MPREVIRFSPPADFDPAGDHEDLAQLQIELLNQQWELRRKQDRDWKGRDHAAVHTPAEWVEHVIFAIVKIGGMPENAPDARAGLVQATNYLLCALESFDVRAARERRKNQTP